MPFLIPPFYKNCTLMPKSHWLNSWLINLSPPPNVPAPPPPSTYHTYRFNKAGLFLLGRYPIAERVGIFPTPVSSLRRHRPLRPRWRSRSPKEACVTSRVCVFFFRTRRVEKTSRFWHVLVFNDM